MNAIVPPSFARPAILAALLAPLAARPAEVGFNRDIRPILSNTCFKCHGPDVKNNQSDVRLDLPDAALAQHKDKTGRVSTPLVPGHPESSEAWRRITSANPDEAMPPPSSHLTLSDHDKQVFREWIVQGAHYEKHWAYVPPKKVAPPAVRDATQVRNPIDRFILAELDAQGIKPSPEADKRTLIRRLSLDLTGLPPTREETEAFVNNPAADAYDRLVDRLLASPHYGERMAVPWLDLARFTDSVGYHGDQGENDFPYREYVIHAFNANKPFDQFTTEQLAGDLIPQATDEQRVATGFNRLNMMTREGGAQPKEYLAKYAADRVRTVATTWLGSTMACCECHDHKFDPFKTRDFYSLEAFFADVKQYGVYTSYKYTPEPDLAGYNNDSPFPPEIEVTSPYLVAREKRCRQLFAETLAAAGRRLLADAAVARWAALVAPRVAANAGGWAVAPAVAVGKGKGLKSLATQPDGSLLLAETKPQGVLDQAEGALSGVNFTARLQVPEGPAAAIRIELLPDPSHDGRVTAGSAGQVSITKAEFELQRAGQSASTPLEIANAFADRETASYTNGELRASLLLGWRSRADYAKTPQAADYLLAAPLNLQRGDTVIVKITGRNVGRIRFSLSPLGCRFPADLLGADSLAAFQAAAAGAPLADAQRRLLAVEYFRATGGSFPADYRRAFAELDEIAACRGGRAFSVVVESAPPRTIRVLPRGDWQNETGEIVAPAVPAFLQTAAPAPGASRQSRLDLARWLVSRENPLTSRNFVNRLWAQFFGAGLSAQIDDLGTRGDYPTHPELLDWLAVEFMDRGWDIKAMVRLMVTSATYRQASTYRPELDDVDPQNRLLARQNARRLDAEFIRDNALFASGLIDLDLGGPSAFPYQPAGYYAPLLFPTRDYVADRDERQYRRGLYTHWQRTFLHPMLANFDAPSREECTAVRTLSSTPQQALTLLNDPTFVEAARGLAERALAGTARPDFASQLDFAFRTLLSRPPRAAEADSLREYYEARLTYYRAHPDDAAKLVTVGLSPADPGLDRIQLAAWTEVARVLLNLNETIVRY